MTNPAEVAYEVAPEMEREQMLPDEDEVEATERQVRLAKALGILDPLEIPHWENYCHNQAMVFRRNWHQRV